MSLKIVQREYQKRLENGTLKGLPRHHSFRFECPDACMGNCCNKIEVYLDPWDVETLAGYLGITGQEFVAEYGVFELGTEWRWPVVHLKHAAHGPCVFLYDDGKCRVYPARPRNCRAYPLGRAVRFLDNNQPQAEERLFLMHAMEGCLGHQADRRWTVEQWLKDSNLLHYHELSDLYLHLLNYAVNELRSREWMHEVTARMIAPFLYAPEIIRARVNIPEREVNHEEFYRRRMQALRILLTEVAAGLGYGPGAAAQGGESGIVTGRSLMERIRPVLMTGKE
ncbi:MAG: YkgJ family cysteine cluster protein [Candidatus Desulforudis sp.]|nr:YkgJ family cysteine cluster protein [Desulforudis sp.]